MKLTQLRDVLAVVEAGTFRGASRSLGIAQSAITRNIREIEHELGVPLFERHAKGVRLSRIGEIFVRRASTIDNELRRAREEVEHFKQNSHGEVSIILSSASAIGLLHSVLPPFRRRFPDTVIKLSEGLYQLAETHLTSGDTDLYVGPLDTSISSTLLSVEHLFANKRMIFCRSGHRLLEARTLEELAGAEWVRPTFTPRDSEADFVEMFEAVGLPPPRVVIHARSALMALLAVSSTDMLTVLAQQWLELPNMLGTVTPIKLDLLLDAAPVCIVRRADLPPTPMAQHMTDLIRRAGLEYARRQTAAHGR